MSFGFHPYHKTYSTPKVPKGLKATKREPSGELVLFRQIYKKRGGKCQVTGKVIPFSPDAFMHVLSKGAYPRFRLNEKNILLVEPEIHYLYDNSSREKLLMEYPKAKFIYSLKEELKIEYYKPQPTV